MEDGDCTEISAQLIRRHTPCRGGYQPPANVANLWAEPIWPGNVAILQNIPCFDMIPPNFIAKCSILPLSALCADVVSHGETTGRLIDAPTTHRNFMVVIRRHPPADHGIRRGGYQPPANVANFWAEPYWPGNVTMLHNIPCFDTMPPNFICKCSMVHCRRNAPTLFPQRGNNRADDIRPYECSEITPAVIRWHSPCRVVHRAANQNPMIAGGDHTIM